MSETNAATGNFYRRNGLSLVFLILTLISLLGQAYTGWQEHNGFLIKNNSGILNLAEYLHSGHFIQATFENWESEFLQMAIFVLLTVYLRQHGSSESKDTNDPDTDPKDLRTQRYSSWFVKKGGIWLGFYKNSLFLVLFIIFAISFILHWYGSWKDFNLQKVLDNKPMVTFIAYLSENRLWFESFQNWQSEFLSVLAIVYFSVYLRQHGSPQSKPVNASNDKTGSE